MNRLWVMLACVVLISVIGNAFSSPEDPMEKWQDLEKEGYEKLKAMGSGLAEKTKETASNFGETAKSGN